MEQVGQSRFELPTAPASLARNSPRHLPLFPRTSAFLVFKRPRAVSGADRVYVYVHGQPAKSARFEFPESQVKEAERPRARESRFMRPAAEKPKCKFQKIPLPEGSTFDTLPPCRAIKHPLPDTLSPTLSCLLNYRGGRCGAKGSREIYACARAGKQLDARFEARGAVYVSAANVGSV